MSEYKKRAFKAARRALAAAATLSLLALAGCLDDQGAGPTVTVDDLSSGAYIVSVGDSASPTVGKYYADASGNRLLVLTDGSDSETLSQYYRRSAGGAWVSVPAATQDTTVTLLRSDSLTTSTVSASALAGSYVAKVASGVTASFTLSSDGSIAAASSSSCKLTGTLTTGTLPNTLKLSLKSGSGCGSLPSSATGVLVVDSDFSPAAFRLLADNGSTAFDLWAYAQ